MAKTLTCELCGEESLANTGNQRTCLDPECQRKLRRKSWSERYYKQRPDPICVWCNKPIQEPRRRKYHAECREDKNRERVRAYNRRRPIRARPKRARDYKSFLRCKCCRKKVKRTGARQIVCLEPACRNWRKRKNKQEWRAIRKRQERVLRAKMNRARPRELLETHRVSCGA